jgi:hypothetical protein
LLVDRETETKARRILTEGGLGSYLRQGMT